jgi:hypothetical protein
MYSSPPLIYKQKSSTVNMQFKLSTVVLASLLAALPALAAPTVDVAAAGIIVPEPEEGLTLTHQITTADGILSYYGTTPGSEISKRVPAPLVSQNNKRCGTNQVSCSNENEGSIPVCHTLIAQVGGSGVVIGESTRSLCLSINSQGTCCISWGNNAAFVESALVSGANAGLNTCSNYKSAGYASAVVRDVLVNGVCIVQCLSNRAKGCPSS